MEDELKLNKLINEVKILTTLRRNSTLSFSNFKQSNDKEPREMVVVPFSSGF